MNALAAAATVDRVLAAGDPSGILIAIAIVVALVVWIFNRGATDKRRKAWAAVAERLGLNVLEADHLAGELDGSRVEVDMVTRGAGKNRRTYTRVRANGGLPEGIELGREGFFSSFTSDLLTGDKPFDGAVRVRGDEGLALALLDAPMRATVRLAIGSGWIFKEGTWLYEVQARLGEEIEVYLQAGAELARELRAASQDVGPRLAERVTSDYDAGVRRRALMHLIAHHAHSPALQTALAAARNDADPRVRFMAAEHERDIAALVALAGDRYVHDELRGSALREACASRRDPAVVALVDSFVDRLSDADFSPELRVAIVRALGVVPNARAEATLMGLLDSQDDATQLEAMRSLGQVGTIAAVPALIPYRERFLAFAMASAAAAKDAILQIQARAGHAEAGALAIAEAGGGLALAGDDGREAEVRNAEAELAATPATALVEDA